MFCFNMSLSDYGDFLSCFWGISTLILSNSIIRQANASKFGSPEYNELKEARLDYPTFKVVTVVKKAARPKFKGLTYEYMEKYISKHDDEAQTIMSEYMVLRAQTEEAEEALAVSASYSDIKNWFFEKYPAVAQFHKTRAQMLADKESA